MGVASAEKKLKKLQEIVEMSPNDAELCNALVFEIAAGELFEGDIEDGTVECRVFDLAVAFCDSDRTEERDKIAAKIRRVLARK